MHIQSPYAVNAQCSKQIHQQLSLNPSHHKPPPKQLFRPSIHSRIYTPQSAPLHKPKQHHIVTATAIALTPTTYRLKSRTIGSHSTTLRGLLSGPLRSHAYWIISFS